MGKGTGMAFFRDYRDHVGSRHDKFYKATLFESPRLLLGLTIRTMHQGTATRRAPEDERSALRPF